MVDKFSEFPVNNGCAQWLLIGGDTGDKVTLSTSLSCHITSPLIGPSGPMTASYWLMTRSHQLTLDDNFPQQLPGLAALQLGMTLTETFAGFSLVE